MKNTRILFFGTPIFAAKILQTLIDEKYNVIAVVSQPDRPQGRKHILTPTPVHALADQFGIRTLQPNPLKDSLEEIRSLNPQLIVTCAYGQFVPQSILDIPEYGCLNIHPSLLPKYRGGAPIHHAIWAGDSETGVCLMEMIKAMDAGRVFANTTLSIGPDETMEELNERLVEASTELVRENLPKYLRGELPGVEQDESKVVIGRNIDPSEEQVHFQQESVQEAYNHIRAFINWPISYGMIDGKRIKFWKARKLECPMNQPTGTVLGFADGAMEIASTGGKILIYELQPEGKSRMSAEAFANGSGKALIGAQFE